MTSTTRPRHGARASLALTLAAALFGAPAAAYADTDPDLDQQLDDLGIVHGQHVLDAGHVDMGPKFDENGEWQLLIHDDAARADANATSVWRYPEETVFHVGDEAILPAPDDPAFDFVGVDPGTDVWVVPQTQNEEVVWLGWNTQDPEVMQRLDRGVTLTLTGVQGPGSMTAYLQAGNFGGPELLWDSKNPEPQPIWVDTNTHTHANWVFTEPGVYLVQLEVAADLADGTTVSDTQLLRFAVGTATNPQNAFAATWEGEAPPEEPESQEQQQDGEDGQQPQPDAVPAPSWFDDPVVLTLVILIVVVAVGLVVGLIVSIARGRRLRQKVRASRASAAAAATDAAESSTEDDEEGSQR
ncbi:choice-of-anchor M domain-containing protein [Gulosibacter sp. 10]|uniref:choice-of-anchor M domain-containing protein n=1 Tax=Gulosibacter sp. 10 TaxID=1255570 RepID=UPI00097F3173|nr:choice-of-anchor M domain-containing protein [Gulosibacter sp. 10]SJM54310.1 hypothetical protein FM112_03445 [Gulosibacter sp. 10]